MILGCLHHRWILSRRQRPVWLHALRPVSSTFVCSSLRLDGPHDVSCPWTSRWVTALSVRPPLRLLRLMRLLSGCCLMAAHLRLLYPCIPVVTLRLLIVCFFLLDKMPSDNSQSYLWFVKEKLLVKLTWRIWGRRNLLTINDSRKHFFCHLSELVVGLLVVWLTYLSDLALGVDDENFTKWNTNVHIANSVSFSIAKAAVKGWLFWRE